MASSLCHDLEFMLNLISRLQTGVYYREGRNSLPGSAAQRSVLCAKAQERDVVCSDSCVVVGHCRQGALAEGLSPRGAFTVVPTKHWIHVLKSKNLFGVDLSL